MSDNN